MKNRLTGFDGREKKREREIESPCYAVPREGEKKKRTKKAYSLTQNLRHNTARRKLKTKVKSATLEN